MWQIGYYIGCCHLRILCDGKLEVRKWCIAASEEHDIGLFKRVGTYLLHYSFRHNQQASMDPSKNTKYLLRPHVPERGELQRDWQHYQGDWGYRGQGTGQDTNTRRTNE